MSLEKKKSVELFLSEVIKVAPTNPGVFSSEEFVDNL